MSDINDIIRQLKEEEEREEAEVKAHKENEAKLKGLQKEIKDFEAEFEELQIQNRELRKEVAEKEFKVNFMQQQKDFWSDVVNKNRTKIKEQEDNLEELQQKIWKDRISFCDMVDEFAKKHDLMAMYRGEMFPEGEMFPDDEKMDVAVSDVKTKSISESQMESSSNDYFLTKNTNIASRPHLENIIARQRVNKNETKMLANEQKAGQVNHTRSNVAELEKELFNVAEEAEALHKFKQSTVSQEYGLKHESPYFKWEATRIPTTVQSGRAKNMNESFDITQRRYSYEGQESLYQPGPSNASRIDTQKFRTRTGYNSTSSGNTNNNNTSVFNIPVATSTTNELKEYSPYEKKFIPKVPSSTLQSSTANMQQHKSQVFKFGLAKHNNINL